MKRKILYKTYNVYQKRPDGSYGIRINDQKDFFSLKDAKDCVICYHKFVNSDIKLVIVENVRSEISYD